MRVLLVEDSPDDAALIVRALKRGGLDAVVQRVDSRAGLQAALRESWSVVISDHNLPSFSGLDALAMVRTSGLDAPFIMVSGAVGEEWAVDAMKAGAHDFVRKDNLGRLVPAILRELREAEDRRARACDRRAKAFLAQVGAVVATPQSASERAEGVARLLVPDLADVGAVVLRVEDRTSLAVARSPALAAAHDGGPDGAALLALVCDEARTYSRDDGMPEVVRTMGGRSALVAPLRARGRKLGGLLLVSARPDAYGPPERELAEEISARVAVAVDNALLYAAAQDAIRLRDEFLSVAAHELRTPLTSLQLLGQSLLRRKDYFASDEAFDRMQRLMRQVGRLGRVVEDVLTVSRLGTGAMPLEVTEADLVAIVRDCVEQLRDSAERAGCAVRVEAPPSLPIRCDPHRVEQICVNLLGNALKFGTGTPVDVTVAGDDAWATISVRDRGIGLAPDDQARVFERFERAVSLRHYGGLGLGLYIAAQIAEAHGGSISVASRVGEGAIFTVRLPRSDAVDSRRRGRRSP